MSPTVKTVMVMVEVCLPCVWNYISSVSISTRARAHTHVDTDQSCVRAQLIPENASVRARHRIFHNVRVSIQVNDAYFRIGNQYIVMLTRILSPRSLSVYLTLILILSSCLSLSLSLTVTMRSQPLYCATSGSRRFIHTIIISGMQLEVGISVDTSLTRIQWSSRAWLSINRILVK